MRIGTALRTPPRRNTPSYGPAESGVKAAPSAAGRRMPASEHSPLTGSVPEMESVILPASAWLSGTQYSHSAVTAGMGRQLTFI